MKIKRKDTYAEEWRQEKNIEEKKNEALWGFIFLIYCCIMYMDMSKNDEIKKPSP